MNLTEFEETEPYKNIKGIELPQKAKDFIELLSRVPETYGEPQALIEGSADFCCPELMNSEPLSMEEIYNIYFRNKEFHNKSTEKEFCQYFDSWLKDVKRSISDLKANDFGGRRIRVEWIDRFKLMEEYVTMRLELLNQKKTDIEKANANLEWEREFRHLYSLVKESLPGYQTPVNKVNSEAQYLMFKTEFIDFLNEQYEDQINEQNAIDYVTLEMIEIKFAAWLQHRIDEGKEKLKRDAERIKEAREKEYQKFSNATIDSQESGSNKKTQQNKESDLNIIGHPEHDPNLWSVDCYDLFKYLYDNYRGATKRRITNIWFYLNQYDPSKYTLKCTKEQYKVFILKNYKIKITNFDKAPTKYDVKDYPSMNEWRMKFENQFKYIAEHVKNT